MIIKKDKLYEEEFILVNSNNKEMNSNNKEIKLLSSFEITKDPLIIMKGLKLSSELGFPIEKKTKMKMFKEKESLKLISPKEIHESLKGIILGEFALKTINEYREIISALIPEIEIMFDYEEQTPGNVLYLWTHSLVVMNNVNPKKHRFEFKLAGLLHDIGKPNSFKMNEAKNKANYFGHEEKSAKIAEEILRKLEFPKEEITKISELIRDHGLEVSEDPYEIEKYLSEMGTERFMDMIEFQIANKYDKTTYKLLGDKRVDKLKRIKKIAESYTK